MRIRPETTICTGSCWVAVLRTMKRLTAAGPTSPSSTSCFFLTRVFMTECANLQVWTVCKPAAFQPGNHTRTLSTNQTTTIAASAVEHQPSVCFWTSARLLSRQSRSHFNVTLSIPPLFLMHECRHAVCRMQTLSHLKLSTTRISYFRILRIHKGQQCVTFWSGNLTELHMRIYATFCRARFMVVSSI